MYRPMRSLQVGSAVLICGLAPILLSCERIRDLLEEKTASFQTIHGPDSEPPSHDFLRAFVTMPEKVCSGGIVVSASYVLTAAHCPLEDSVTLAATNSSFEVHKKKRCCHPCFKRSNGNLHLSHDLALWRLTSAVPQANRWDLHQVILDPQGAGFATVAVHLGQPWRTMSIGVLPSTDCSKAQKNSVGAEEFCAGTSQSNICDGASGGPFFKVDSASQPTHLAGIVSDDENGPCEGMFDLYTKIDRAWIRGVMAGKNWCGDCRSFSKPACDKFKEERALVTN